MATVRIPVDLTWTGASGSPGVNVWHARLVGVPGPSDDLAAAAAILEDFYTAIADMYCTDVQIRFAGVATGVGDDTGDVWTTDPWTVNGSNGTDHLPPANAVIIQWFTDSGGRSGRGRTFLSPLIQGASESNGTPGEAERTEFLTAAQELIEASDTFSNGALGVYSRTENVFRDFTSCAVPNYFAVLRSRRD